MSNIEALKEQARRHEQNEEWQKACDLYQRAIERLNQDDQPDIGLYNRVGDLQIRLGNYDQATQSFERATDLYMEAELPNNAIAVCKKVIRHLPNRIETYLRMGQIRASQGFLVDARENFLKYAEKMQAAGDTERALEALVEFAGLAPEDTEIRLAVATQLLQHARRDEALEQFVAGYRVLASKGDTEAAAPFRDRILELDPEADLAALAATPSEGDGFAFESTALGSLGDSGLEMGFGEIELPDRGPPGPATGSESRKSDGGAVEGEEEFSEISFEGAGEVPGAVGDSAVADPVDEDAPDGGGDEHFAFGEDLPLLPIDDEPEPMEEAPLADLPLLSLGEEVVARDEGEVDAGVEDFAHEAEIETEEPLPFLALDEGEAEPEHEDLSAGVSDALASALEDAPAPTSLRGRWERLRRECSEDPSDLGSPEELVELAFKLDDQGVLVESYLVLAGALAKGGHEARARSVLQQVLTLDPENADALRGLSPDSTPAPRSRPTGDYVDLGALIFDEEEEKTTRFRVAYEEPSGDEEADFARMLSQFKAKVAENFEVSDVKAHHDLGTAYKEMGLLDEAVEKFQQALRASPGHLPSYELLGQVFMEMGQNATAVRVMERALKVPSQVDDEFIGIYYYLARAHEDLGNTREAREFYDRVFALDINFADVTERLRQLR